jgi:hypothetical protein
VRHSCIVEEVGFLVIFQWKHTVLEDFADFDSYGLDP